MPKNPQKPLIGLLLLLMLGNSSYALEILAHGSHQHGEALTTQQRMEPATGHDQTVHQHHHASMYHAHAASTVADAVINSSTRLISEDCVCDDICCASAAAYTPVPEGRTQYSLTGNFRPANLPYQSITIALPKPPPIA
jgi:pantothenate kinase type III